MIKTDFVFLIVLTLALFLGGNSHAVTAPTGFSNNNWAASTRFNYNFTALQACQANYPLTTQAVELSDAQTTAFAALYNGVTYNLRFRATKQYACRKADGQNAGAYSAVSVAFCSGGVNPSGTAPNYTCPTCPTNYIDIGGVCVLQVNCPTSGTIKSTGIYLLGTNPDASVPTIACDAECTTTYSGYGVSKRATVNGVYNYYYGEGNYAYTGTQCNTGTTSPTTTSVPPNTCNPATQDSGQVNGVTVCINKTKVDNTNNTTSPPVTDANGNTTTTTTETSNDTEKDTTTTTTTTKTTAADGTITVSSSQTTTANPVTPFCQANPTDPTCLKNSDFCKNNPETLGCSTLGTVEDSTLTTKAAGISNIAPVTVGNAGTCPPPLTASFMGQAVEFSFDPLCQYANSLRPLVLALAWLASGLIFIGGVKN